MKVAISLILSLILALSASCMTSCNTGDTPDGKSTTTTKDEGTTTPPPAEPDMTPGSIDNPTYMGEGPLSVTVEAGKTYHIAVKNPGGQTITIASPNACITYNNTTYEAIDGVLTLVLNAESGDGRVAAILGISAKDGAAATFEVQIEAPLGSMGNPIVLSNLDDLHVAVQKDSSVYYQWTATENGDFYVNCNNVKSNIVLNVDNRTTGESNGAVTSSIGLEKGETVVIAIGTIGTATIPEGVDLTFSFEEADPAADFVYNVSVKSLIEGGLEGVTVEIYTEDGTLVTTLVTDENGSATYTGLWADCYAKVILPDGYTPIADNDEDPSNDTLADFHLKSGLFGGSNAVFTLVSPENEDEE
ncbi:MAG: hypothetical protein IJW29_06575 [Clostridia bacterium]|nr:hypothetical protein [Clostridia bacterium]